jgi:hypothetical protein
LDSRAVCPKRLAMLTGWKRFVMDGIPAVCSEHVPGQAIMRQSKAISTAVRQQFQWDSQDTCSHHGASHAAAGGRQASRCGIISQARRTGQGVPAGREWLESARQPVEPISGSETRGRASL